MDFPEDPFWDFSLALHQKPGVYPACLELQRNHGLDVNLLFYCLWVGAAGAGGLSPEAFGRVLASIGQWQEEVVRPIWRARWKLKPSYPGFPAELTEPLRKALIQAELDAEHLEQIQLGRCLELTFNPGLPPEKRAADAAANLALYLKGLFSGRGETAPRDNLVSGGLSDLLAAAFPELGAGKAEELLHQAPA